MAVASHPQRESRVLTDVGGEGPAVMRHKSSSGTYKTEIGNSQFYSKPGILPIFDSNESLDSNKRASATIKMRQLTSQIFDGSRFPKLEECAHFHYDVVELSEVRVNLATEDQENLNYRYHQSTDVDQPFFYISVSCNTKTWIIKRTYENFRMLDKQLHKCIYDRKFSQLPEIPKGRAWIDDDTENLDEKMNGYLVRFSQIADSMVNCGPILNWFEMDNRGNRLMVTNESAINTPAIAAAHVIKRYTARAPDEICFEVGDIISVIDMPPTEDTVWWRGKKDYEVGFFPSECVEIIGDKLPQSMAHKLPLSTPKPVLRRRGKIISFLRMFFFTRPSKTSLKQSGIMKERVFGCDLGEHLLNTGQDVPLVLKCCTEIIEKHGIVDGIYRLSGVASNIQKLRCAFDENRIPELTEEEYLQDIHCISSLLKMYFRELPNPLLTYQLYDKFAAAVQDEDDKLMLMFDVVQQLPPPHYRTSQFLFRHLSKVAAHGHDTGMHPKNLAIVWAPNLLRSKELESGCGAAALQGVGLQAVVTEFLILYADVIFSDKTPAFIAMGDRAGLKRTRPKSLAISTPTKLLSLEEARERVLTVVTSSPNQPQQHFIEVGGGPTSLPEQYHTVIDFPGRKRSSSLKGKKTANVDQRISGSNWKSFFMKNRSSSGKKRKHSAPSSPEPAPMLSIITGLPLVAPDTTSAFSSSSSNNEDKPTTAITEEDVSKHKIRSTKSEETISTSSDSDKLSADFGGYNFSSFQLGGIPKFSLELGEGVRKSKTIASAQSTESIDSSGTVDDCSANSNSPDEDEVQMRSSELGDMIIAAEAANIAKKTQHLTEMEEEMCMDLDRTSTNSRLSQSLPPVTSGPRRSSLEIPESKSEIKLVEFTEDPIAMTTISRVSSISEIMARAFPNASSVKKKSKSPSMSPPMLKYSRTGTPPARSRSLMKSTGSSSSSLSSPPDTIDHGRQSFHHSTGSLISPDHQKLATVGGALHSTPSDDIFPMEMTESVDDFLIMRHLSTNSESGLISPADSSTSQSQQHGKIGLRRTRSARMNRQKEEDPHRHHLHRTPSVEMSQRSSDDIYIGPETEMEEVFTLSEPTIQSYLSLPPEAERALDDFDTGFSRHSFLVDDDLDSRQYRQQSSQNSSNDEFRQDSMDSDGLKTPDLDIGDFVNEMRSIVEGSKLETEFSPSPEEIEMRFEDSTKNVSPQRSRSPQMTDDDVVMQESKDVSIYALTRPASTDDDDSEAQNRRSYEALPKSSSESSPIHVAANIALPKTPDSDEWKPWSYDDGGTLSPDFSKYDVQYNELQTEVEKYLSPSEAENALNLPPIRKSQSYERAISGGDLEAVYTPLTEDEGKRFSAEIRELQMIGETDEKSPKSPVKGELSDQEIIINYPPTPKEGEVIPDEGLRLNDEIHRSQLSDYDLIGSTIQQISTSPTQESEPTLLRFSPELTVDSSPVHDENTEPEVLHFNPECSPTHHEQTEPDILHFSPEPTPESSPVHIAKPEPEVLHYSPEPSLQSSPVHVATKEPEVLHYSPESSLESSPVHVPKPEPEIIHYSPEPSPDFSNNEQTTEADGIRFSPEILSPQSPVDYEPHQEQHAELGSSHEQVGNDETGDTKLYAKPATSIEPEVLHFSPEPSPASSPIDKNIHHITDKIDDLNVEKSNDDLSAQTDTGSLSRRCIFSDDEESGRLHLTSVLGTLRTSQQQYPVTRSDDNDDEDVLHLDSQSNKESETDQPDYTAPLADNNPVESQSLDDDVGLTDSWECIETGNFAVYEHEDDGAYNDFDRISDDRKHFIDIDELPKPEDLGLTVKVAEEENEVIIERPSPVSGSPPKMNLTIVDDPFTDSVRMTSSTDDIVSVSPEKPRESSPNKMSVSPDDRVIPRPKQQQQQSKQFRSSIRKPSDDRMCSSLEGRIDMFEKLKEPITSSSSLPKSFDDHDIKSNSEPPPVFSRHKSDLEPTTVTKQPSVRSSQFRGVRACSDSVGEISPKTSKKTPPPPVSEKPKSIPSLGKSDSSPSRVRKSDSSFSYGQTANSAEVAMSSDNHSDDSIDRSGAEIKREKSIKSLMSRFEGGQQTARVESLTPITNENSSQVKVSQIPTKVSQIPIPREKEKPRPAVFQKPKFVRLRSLSPDTNSLLGSGKLTTKSSEHHPLAKSSDSDDSGVVMRQKRDAVAEESKQQREHEQRTVSAPVVPDKPKRPSLSRSRFTNSSLGASDDLRERFSDNDKSASIKTSSNATTSHSRTQSHSEAVETSSSVTASNIPRLSRSTSMQEEKPTLRYSRKDRATVMTAASFTGRTRTSSHNYDQEDEIYEKLQESFRHKRTSLAQFEESGVVMVNSSNLRARFSDPKSPTSAVVTNPLMTSSYSNDNDDEPDWAKEADAEFNEPKIEPPPSRPKLRFFTAPREVPVDDKETMKTILDENDSRPAEPIAVPEPKTEEKKIAGSAFGIKLRKTRKD